MNREKAVRMALKIVDVCKSNNGYCTQCPFNFNGCIVTADEHPIEWDEPPIEWHVNDIFDYYKRRMMEVNKDGRK